MNRNYVYAYRENIFFIVFFVFISCIFSFSYNIFVYSKNNDKSYNSLRAVFVRDNIHDWFWIKNGLTILARQNKWGYNLYRAVIVRCANFRLITVEDFFLSLKRSTTALIKYSGAFVMSIVHKCFASKILILWFMIGSRSWR